MIEGTPPVIIPHRLDQSWAASKIVLPNIRILRF